MAAYSPRSHIMESLDPTSDVQHPGLRVQDLRFRIRVQGLGSLGSGSRVQGLGSEVRGPEFMVQAKRIRVQRPRLIMSTHRTGNQPGHTFSDQLSAKLSSSCHKMAALQRHSFDSVGTRDTRSHNP